ncbi:unnamed protein product [Prorocentrum cordatum]|uniref:Uncharacterized protein n=1 Tax=Prorocentrum cordatum TaxID=2364126 RepID=A0ABN9PFZ0_9DINO|nr:unnamed protein product [Polarella glacialis]
MFGISCRQDVQSPNSCEAEWHAGARGLSEGLGLKALFTLMGYSVRLSWRCDSSSARQGTGRIKHLATKTLWIQQLVAKKIIIIIDPVAGDDNLADLGTKVLPRARLEWLRESCGLKEVPVPGTSRVAGVGAMPTGFQAQSTLLKALLAVAASLPTAVNGGHNRAVRGTAGGGWECVDFSGHARSHD